MMTLLLLEWLTARSGGDPEVPSSCQALQRLNQVADALCLGSRAPWMLFLPTCEQ